MPRACLTARVAALAAVYAVGAPVAIATASAAADTQATTTLAESVAPVTANNPGVGAVSGAESKTIPLSSVPDGTTSPTTTVSGPTVRTPAPERTTVRAGGTAAVAATSTAQGFLGIATELTTIPTLSGSAADPDTPFLQLLRNLSPGAPLLLRLGGVSADDSWWAIPGMKKPPYLYTLTPRWGADVQALLTALGGKAILGVNLKEDSKIASAEVADFNRYVGASLIDDFELGNEPEFYPLSVVNGLRGHDTIADYGKKFSNIASALGGAPLAGPGSGSPHWLSKLGTMLSDMPSRLKLVTVHAYPMKNCSRIAHLSVSDFFARASIQGLADSIHETVKAAAAHGKPLRVDEINGIPCGGEAGLSNSFGEALWALNVLLALWQAGVQGVNFQTVDGNLNQMITAKHSASGWSVSVEPEYYGLLTFADAAPAGSHLLRISNPGLAHFYQFAVRAPDGSERVVLTNVGSVARTIGVTASGTRGTGSLSVLSAKSLSAAGGTTLAGRRLSSRTGQLTGTPSLTLVRPNAKGVYAVRVPAHAAAILTLSA
jgi:hypothetical protein